jgi:hypothetical protein
MVSTQVVFFLDGVDPDLSGETGYSSQRAAVCVWSEPPRQALTIQFSDVNASSVTKQKRDRLVERI